MSPLLKMRRPRDNRNETAKTKKKKPTQLQKILYLQPNNQTTYEEL